MKPRSPEEFINGADAPQQTKKPIAKTKKMSIYVPFNTYLELNDLVRYHQRKELKNFSFGDIVADLVTREAKKVLGDKKDN